MTLSLYHTLGMGPGYPLPAFYLLSIHFLILPFSTFSLCPFLVALPIFFFYPSLSFLPE